MGIRQFHEGIAFERPLELDGTRRTPAEAAGILAGDDGPGLLIQGQPGAGKSTLLRNVAYAWVDAGYGSVFYRPSGASVFDNLERVISAVERTDDQLLIAVEDAAREEAHLTYNLMARHADDDRVTFLLDSRSDEWANLEPATSRESTMATRFDELVENLRQARPAPLTEADCVDIVTRYEAVTESTARLAGEDAQARGTALYDRLQGHTNAGAMLYVSFLLSGMNGFENDVLSKVKTIEDPDPDERLGLSPDLTELIRHSGLLIAALGAINDRAMHREYLFAVAAELSTRRRYGTYTGEEVAELLYDGFDGWLLFDGSTARRYRTYHEFWSYWYLRTLLSDEHLGKEQRARDRFARCLRSIARLHTGDLDREWQYDLETYTEKLPPTEFTAGSSEGSESAGAGERIELGAVVDAIYDLAERYPVVADLLSVQHRRVRDALTDSLPPARVAGYAVTVGTAYNTLGDLEAARAEFEVAEDLLETVDEPPSEIKAARLYGLASVLKTEGAYDAALNRLADARAELNGTDSDAANRLFAKVAQMTGDINSVRSDFDEAERWYRRITERVTDESLAALQADRLGSVARKRGRLEDAVAHYQEGLQKARRIGDRKMEATTARHVALVNRRLVDAGRFDSESERAAMLAEAADLLEESLMIADQLGDEHERAAVLGNLSLVRLLQEHSEAAEERAREGIEVTDRLTKPAEEGWMRNNLGDAYLAQGQVRAAAAEYELSRRLNEFVGNRRETARSLRGLSETARSHGDIDRADRLLASADEISEAIGDEHAGGSDSQDIEDGQATDSDETIDER
jgi:tetratricopeptide (TPR) repeat protein